MRITLPSNAPTRVAAPLGGIKQHIGRAGMSDVYKVKGADGWRALKLARKEVYGAERSLRDEATAYERIGPHPNIMRYFGSGTFDNRFFLQLEYLNEARFLAENDERAIEEAHVVRIARGLAAALAHIHERGFVHGDIKPDNVWMGNVPMLFGFGLAKKAGYRGTSSEPIHDGATVANFINRSFPEA